MLRWVVEEPVFTVMTRTGTVPIMYLVKAKGVLDLVDLFKELAALGMEQVAVVDISQAPPRNHVVAEAVLILMSTIIYRE